MAKTTKRTSSAKRSHIRRHHGKPATDDYIRGAAGMAGTKGKLLKSLITEKAKEKES